MSEDPADGFYFAAGLACFINAADDQDDNWELREDGSAELREDGSIELREPL